MILTSVSSNFVRAVASPSATERYCSRAGWPTIEDEVSRCWFVIHSLRGADARGKVSCLSPEEERGDRVRGRTIWSSRRDRFLRTSTRGVSTSVCSVAPCAGRAEGQSEKVYGPV